MPFIYNSFSPASLVILAMSSGEELVIGEASEEFVIFEAFEHVAKGPFVILKTFAWELCLLPHFTLVVDMLS